jgi:hypothetical protein
MKKNLSKIVLLASLIVGLSSYTSNAQTVTKSEDLDMDGKADNIVLTVEKDAFFGQLYKNISINGKSFDLSQYNANKFSVLDINSKDKQKEIVFTSMGEDSMGDAYIHIQKQKFGKNRQSFCKRWRSTGKYKVEQSRNTKIH